MALEQEKDIKGKQAPEDYQYIERRFWKNLTRFPATYGADVLGAR